MNKYFKILLYLLVMAGCVIAAADHGTKYAIAGFGISSGLLLEAFWSLLTDQEIREVSE